MFLISNLQKVIEAGNLPVLISLLAAALSVIFVFIFLIRFFAVNFKLILGEGLFGDKSFKSLDKEVREQFIKSWMHIAISLCLLILFLCLSVVLD